MIDMVKQLANGRIATTQIDTNKINSTPPKYVKTLSVLTSTTTAGAGAGYLICKYYEYPHLVKKFKNKRTMLRNEFEPILAECKYLPFSYKVNKDFLNWKIKSALSSAKEMLYFAKKDYPIKGAIIGLGIGLGIELITIVLNKIKENKKQKS